ncbi:MAG: hypothetical protein R3C19_11235 [Planctomycetaceae bacterium]
MLTKAASLAVCFGVLMSGPVMAGAESIIRDVEISKDGTLYGVVHNSAGHAVASARFSSSIRASRLLSLPATPKDASRSPVSAVVLMN